MSPLNLRPRLHYLLEDHAAAIGHAISGWIAGIEQWGAANCAPRDREMCCRATTAEL